MFAAFSRFAVLRRFARTAALAALTFGVVFFVPSFSASGDEKTPTSSKTFETDAPLIPSNEPGPRRQVVLKAPLATLRKSADASQTPNAAPFAAPELNASAAPLDDAIDANSTPSDAADVASRTLFGREIADY
ncbi:MAG: hypothetical protein IIW01_03520, partial [Thermoguttaceae bacterium]|nr:hypothetical protein [Thermoguttaceae bacterium]